MGGTQQPHQPKVKPRNVHLRRRCPYYQVSNRLTDSTVRSGGIDPRRTHVRFPNQFPGLELETVLRLL